VTPEHLLKLLDRYENELVLGQIPKKRMDVSKCFSSISPLDRLAHAHYLIEGCRAAARDLSTWDKANRHLTAIQMCMSFAGLYSLAELMEHNRVQPQVAIRTMSLDPQLPIKIRDSWAPKELATRHREAQEAKQHEARLDRYRRAFGWGVCWSLLTAFIYWGSHRTMPLEFANFVTLISTLAGLAYTVGEIVEVKK
jgi:hypothetical protein